MKSIRNRRGIISLKNIALIIECTLLLLTMTLMFFYIKDRERKLFLGEVLNSTHQVDGHLKFMTDLYSSRKILKRYLDGEGQIDDLMVFTKNRTKNNPSTKYFISLKGRDMIPALPSFIPENLLDKEYPKVSMISSHESFFHIKKINIKNSFIINLYNPENDELLKQRIKKTLFDGFFLETDKNNHLWLSDGVDNNYRVSDLSNYKVSFRPQLVKIPNKAEVPGVFYLASDVKHSNNVIRSLILSYVIFIVLFCICVKVTFLFSNILESLIHDINDISSGYKKKSPGKYTFFKEYNNIINQFNHVINAREYVRLELEAANRDMENKVKKRTEDLYQAIKEVEDASRGKMNFLAQISHEIRTPMNCIIGFCEMIIDEKDKSDNDKYAHRIIEESETLLKLINDILDDSKIESGKMTLECNNVNLHSFFDKITGLGNPYQVDINLDVSYTIDTDLPEYIGIDELRMYQVVSNIYFNALKYTPMGSVKINVVKSGINNIVISINDTGIGIPQDRLSSIFEDYERLNGKLATRFRGTGLGLTITKKIIEVMNGFIEVQSEQGVGSCFTVILPYKEVGAIDNLSKSVVKKDLNLKITGNVLLVEDYPTNRIIAKKHLESAGLKVYIAENGKEAIDICTQVKFNIILMDIQMPVMDGFTAAEMIRSDSILNSDCPIVAMTANSLRSVNNRAEESGMNDIILKPIRKAILLETVEEHISSKVCN